MKTPVLFFALIVLAPALPLAAANSAAGTLTSARTATGMTAIDGQVLESINSAGYTYFLVASGKQKIWVAATEVALKVGDRVTVAGGMPMANYHSKTLNRTFDVVYFTSSVAVNGKPGAAPATSAARATSTRSTPAVDLSNIKRAPDGQTVTEVFAGSANLSGKKVTFRGRVVKYNAGILGKNWLHVRAGPRTCATRFRISSA